MDVSGIGSLFGPAPTTKQSANSAGSTFSAALDSVSDKTGQTKSDPAQEFLDYMHKTPTQRMQDSWLAAHGISSKDFAAMSDEDKQKVIAQMKQDIEEKMKEQAKSSRPNAVNFLV